MAWFPPITGLQQPLSLNIPAFAPFGPGGPGGLRALNFTVAVNSMYLALIVEEL